MGIYRNRAIRSMAKGRPSGRNTDPQVGTLALRPELLPQG